MNMNLSYANLDRETKRSLAVSMAKVGATELDHALAAFWLILGRHNRQADQHLGQTSADLAGEVRAAFAGGGAGEPDAE